MPRRIRDPRQPRQVVKSQVRGITSAGQLKKLLQSNQKQQVFLKAYTNQCGHCRTIAPIYQELADKFPDAVFLEVDIGKVPEVKQKLGVKATPQFHAFPAKQKVLTGGQPQALRQWVHQCMGGAV